MKGTLGIRNMNKHLLILWFVAVWLLPTDGKAEDETNTLFGYILVDLKGREYSLGNLSQNKASIIIFLSPDCPICQKYTLTLRNMVQDYEQKNIKVYGVFTGQYFTKKKIKRFNKKYKLNFPVYLDPELDLAKYLSATITPEVFLADSTGEILYSGMIDNWFVRLGVKRQLITERYLSDAISAYLGDEEISVKKTKSVGCFIEY